MAKNIGKVFEEEFKSSINNEHWYYRFNDGTSAYNKDIANKNIRFQAKNICDCQVMARDKLFLLELKNTKGASLPFTNIKANQVEGLSNINHNKIKAYFIVCFRDKEKCYAVEAKLVKYFIDKATSRSIPQAWFKSNCIEIPMIKKRVRYKYDLELLFREVVESDN
ncbi:Holliday junction resolvase RecU [Clostridium gasigenes]|uniref:Holliday junction resolvase RecU n=1 Tax=Clostridium gasigenes TaxID=94869 RepID=UPI001C0B0163|nr:Holliday junction resolvase RecU [Clostridium gasigenes]MBU3102964.1 Holliday junction resolvase RecU [Clostridium gasigenes]